MVTNTCCVVCLCLKFWETLWVYLVHWLFMWSRTWLELNHIFGFYFCRVWLPRSLNIPNIQCKKACITYNILMLNDFHFSSPWNIYIFKWKRWIIGLIVAFDFSHHHHTTNKIRYIVKFSICSSRSSTTTCMQSTWSPI